MNVCIIGGTGLISTGITRQLVDAGHEVTCFTRGESEARVPEAVSFVHGDRNEPDALATIRETEPDCVIDMVCFTPEQARDAIDVFAGEIDQYVFCSTVDVYARPAERNPITEDAQRHDDEHFVSEYGENKTLAEDAFMAAHERGDFATTVIRPWSTYGEGGGVLHTFGKDTYVLDRIRAGKPIIVHGDGSSIWGPCHRDDVASAFVNAIGNTTAYGEAYHVTSEENVAWDVYYQKVARAMDAPAPEFVHIPTDVLLQVAPDRTGMLDAHLQYSTVFDNSKAKRDLDFAYTIGFEEGTRRTIDWLVERDRIESWESEPFDDALIDAWQASTETFVAEFAG